MPVFRTPDGRIVEETTLVKPPGSKPGRDADGDGRDAPGGAGASTVYEAPTVLRRPDETGGTATRPLDKTKPFDEPGPLDEERTKLAGAVPATRRRPGASGRASERDEAEVDPVAGWLVVVDGPGTGRDLRIGVGRNEVGRSRENRIAMPFGDSRISRRRHLWVTYDPRHRVFSVAPGSGANLAYLDDAAIEAPMPLADGATILVGKTRLRFAAFCGDRFSWSED